MKTDTILKGLLLIYLLLLSGDVDVWEDGGRSLSARTGNYHREGLWEEVALDWSDGELIASIKSVDRETNQPDRNWEQMDDCLEVMMQLETGNIIFPWSLDDYL